MLASGPPRLPSCARRFHDFRARHLKLIITDVRPSAAPALRKTRKTRFGCDEIRPTWATPLHSALIPSSGSLFLAAAIFRPHSTLAREASDSNMAVHLSIHLVN